MFKFLFLFYCVVFSVQSNSFASFGECPSGTNDCVLNTARAIFNLILQPNEKIGAEDMDPMHHNLVEGDLTNVKYKLTNTTVLGFKSCNMEKASFDQETRVIQLECLCPKFEMYGQYYLKGSILLLTLEGNGDYKIETGKYSLNVSFKLGGPKYETIKNFTFKAKPLESVHYHLTNIHGSNNESGDEILNYMNSNWKAVTLLLQGPAFQAHLQKIRNNGNKYVNN